MTKAIIYIDGQNFHFGLGKLLGINYHSYFIDFNALASWLANGKDLVATKYFAAKFPYNVSAEKHKRDSAFYQHLAANQGVKVIEGRFKIREENGRKIVVEKGVDVRLATELIFDAVHNNYDHAYVLSDDTDLIPAIVEVKNNFPGKKIFNFAFQKLNEFDASCDICKQFYPNILKKYYRDADYFVDPTKSTMQDLLDKFGSKKARF